MHRNRKSIYRLRGQQLSDKSAVLRKSLVHGVAA